MIARLLSALGLVKGIMLEDFQGQVYYTWERKGVSRNVCHVYPIFKVGNCLLNSDGTVDPRSSSSYIKYWKYL
jgi:hypothetical protein